MTENELVFETSRAERGKGSGCQLPKTNPIMVRLLGKFSDYSEFVCWVNTLVR